MFFKSISKIMKVCFAHFIIHLYIYKMLKNIVLNLEDRMTFDHHPNLPKSSFRMLIVGASGCGKTSLITTFLLEPGFFDYNNLIIFTSTPNQQEYQLLYHGFKNKLTKET